MAAPLPHIIIINGPNLNLIGKRQPEIYGSIAFDAWFDALRQRRHDVRLSYFQSNHEGYLIDKIQACEGTADGIVLNAGGYTHTSVALRDAVAAVSCPVVEVHISDIMHREPFRRFSYLTDVCRQTIIGQGLHGYELAIDELLKMI
ncbi:MAG: type II 3-dehydroquinate dehydratase [Paludibacter sp.]|nr:type II 3-dehydroquinate dehydratase [Bacteroidales bacterium]MCM1068832.1 type II 3-dehydroquinate dehydratase [Prevotella sp.]MCM1353093.1 type II 3-dehydroquinate dehydratase [Bacteroides sp.]MCM1442415.1 type II 3-dehydroquinate dehydratase [Muribaculum sp.]MCM1481258.1 type II 3-dehydroquinate dehydratase [Paludibacter sp.]